MATEIENLLSESRRFLPTTEFVAQANAKPELYSFAASDRLGFWAEQARQLHWHREFTETLDWSDAPFARWFADGELNVSYNCLDRHVVAAGVSESRIF